MMRQAGENVTDRADNRDRYAKPRGGCDRIVDWLAVEREHDVGERAAADPHERAREADDKAIASHRHCAGQIRAEVPAIASEEKFHSDEAGNQHEGDLEDGGRSEGCYHCATPDADYGRKRP